MNTLKPLSPFHPAISKPVIVLAATVLQLSLLQQSHAGNITSVLNVGAAQGNGIINSGVVTTGLIGNDNTALGSTNPDLLTVTRTYTAPGFLNLSFGTHGTVNGPDSLPTEYFVTETINNNSGSTWQGFTVSLFSGFAFDLDTPNLDPTPVSPFGAPTTHTANQIVFMGGTTIPSGSSFTLSYSLDISSGFADGSSALLGTPTVVPEPSAAALSMLSVGLCGFIRLRRRAVQA